LRLLSIIRLMKLLNSGMFADAGKAAEAVQGMGGLHGFWQKVGQHLSLYSFETTDIFSPLQEMGKVDESVLDDFRERYPHVAGNLEFASEQPIASASIGQVYKCSYEGTAVALKIQHRKIKKALGFDLWILNIMSGLLRLLPNKNINTARNQIIDIIKQEFENETNYRKELRCQNLFANFFSSESFINVPVAFEELLTTDSLVSEWVEGESILQRLKTGSLPEKQWILGCLHYFYFRSLFKLGMIHADPHPGNFLVLREEQFIRLNIIDFGAVIDFPQEQLRGLKAILLHIHDLTPNEFIDIYLSLGFNSAVVEEYASVLPDISAILFEPFLTDGSFNIRQWRLQYKLNTLLASRTWSTGLIPPRPVLYLLRVMHGLYYYQNVGNLSFNWRKSLLECV